MWQTRAVLHRSDFLLVHAMCAELHPTPHQSARDGGWPVLALATYTVHDPFVVALEVISRGRLLFCWFLDRRELLAATVPRQTPRDTNRDVAEPTPDLVTVTSGGSARAGLLTIDRGTLRRFLAESTRLLRTGPGSTAPVDLDAELTDLLAAAPVTRERP